jgi:hypothetical protein
MVRWRLAGSPFAADLPTTVRPNPKDARRRMLADLADRHERLTADLEKLGLSRAEQTAYPVCPLGGGAIGTRKWASRLDVEQDILDLLMAHPCPSCKRRLDPAWTDRPSLTASDGVDERGRPVQRDGIRPSGSFERLMTTGNVEVPWKDTPIQDLHDLDGLR